MRGRWIVPAAVCAASLLWAMPVGLAAAEAPLEAGWWWRAQHGAGGPDLPAGGSGVPAGQFPVEFSGHQASARTAVQLPLDQAVAASLTLALDLTASVNPGAADVVACPATDGWPREEGGRWANQPLFDCSRGAVGEYDDQAGTVVFDLAPVVPFAREGILNVLITPAGDTTTPSIAPPVPSGPEADAWRIVTLPFPEAATLETTEPAPAPEDHGDQSSTGGPDRASAPPPMTPPAPSSSQSFSLGRPQQAMPPMTTEDTDPAPLVAAPEDPAPAVAAPAAPVTVAPELARVTEPGPRWGLGLLVGLLGLGTYLPQRLSRDRIAILRSLSEDTGAGTAALEVVDLGVQFGGVVAVDGVSFSVPRRAIVGLIGPNGAGKTTVLDAITGTVPASGRVCIEGVDVSSVSTAGRCSVGLGRSFQDGRLFPSLTVRDTLAVAMEQHTQRLGAVTGLIGLGPSRANERDVTRRVDELLGLFGLEAFADKFVSELSTGSRRMVDLAAQVAHGAKVLLLDEPSSGIAQKETEALAPVLRQLRDQLDATIVLIEHDMPLITTIADRIIALEVGRVIADGTPEAVINDPRVVEAYLGTDDAVINRSGVVEDTEVDG